MLKITLASKDSMLSKDPYVSIVRQLRENALWNPQLQVNIDSIESKRGLPEVVVKNSNTRKD